MGLENSKRWHWALAGLAVGPLLAFVNLQSEAGEGWPTVDGMEFARDVQLHDLPGGKGRIENIVIHPTIPAEQSATHTPVTPVTMRRWTYDESAKGWRARDYALHAQTPFDTSGGFRKQAIPRSQTVQSVLAELAAKNPEIKYKTAWWEEPKKAYAVWTGGALALVGGIWPTVLSLLTGAGLGPKKSAEKEYDLERFGKADAAAYGEEEEAAADDRRAKEMSEDDRRKLQEQIAAIERNVGVTAVGSDVPAPAPAAAAEAAPTIRQLAGGPLQVATDEKEDENKEYKGEFYPVAKVQKEPAGQAR